MQIAALAVVHGSNSVPNQGVLDLLGIHSPLIEPRLHEVIGRLLQRTGAETRRWRKPDETPLDLTLRACRQALDTLGGDRPTMLICASVFELVREPSSASLLAQLLGLLHADTFDIKIACAGWMRAVEIAQQYFATGYCGRIMIVNPEFPMTPGFGVFPNVFTGLEVRHLEHRLPGFTLGECAAATILESAGPPWKFHWRTDNSQCDACTIPAPWHGLLDIPIETIGHDAPGTFTSYASRLYDHAHANMLALMPDVNTDGVDFVFTHGSSDRDWRNFTVEVDLGNQYVSVYPKYGNQVSACIPVAIDCGLQGETPGSRKLVRGNKVLAMVASAGMVFCIVEFEY